MSSSVPPNTQFSTSGRLSPSILPSTNSNPYNGSGGYHSQSNESDNVTSSSLCLPRASSSYAATLPPHTFRSSGKDDEFTVKYDSIASELPPGYEKFCAIRTLWTGGLVPTPDRSEYPANITTAPSTANPSANHFGMSSSNSSLVGSANSPQRSNPNPSLRQTVTQTQSNSKRPSSGSTSSSTAGAAAAATNSTTSPKPPKKPVMDSETICDILVNSKCTDFKHRVPLAEVVEVLVELWEDEGLFE